MNDDKTIIPQDEEGEVVATDVSTETFRSVFRLLFAGEDALFELYSGSITIGTRDLDELNSKILEKLRHFEIRGLAFSALASYENGRAQEYSSWQKFSSENWSTPDVLDSLSLTWNFSIKFPKSPKLAPHCINVRISSSIKPQHLMQAIFSKQPEDIDKIDLRLVPMSCRVNFVDHILSEELLDLVSKWHKGLRSPEFVFPFMKKIKRHSDQIQELIRNSIPALSAIACFGYYFRYARRLESNSAVTAEMLTDTVLWLALSCAIIFISLLISKTVAGYVDKQLHRFGAFTVFQITNGDKKKQTRLQARSQNSYLKFIASSIFALLWNIISGVITAFLLKE